jgi:dienelactone hydrolase
MRAILKKDGMVLLKMNLTKEDETARLDPRAEALEIEITEERVSDGIAVSSLYFTSHRIGGEPVRIFGLYARPEKTEVLLPGILFIHGAGQTVDEPEVLGWARRGYAAFSHNWYPTEEVGQANRPNRWPSDEQGKRKTAAPAELDEALWINRRALTLLERQPGVDPDRLGVCGFSMGAYHTWDLTASESRIKAAIPSCGRSPKDVMGRLRAPTLFISGSEDFSARLNVLQADMKSVTVEHRRLVSPNENHNMAGVPWETTRQAWFDHYLKDGPPLAPSPLLSAAREGKTTQVRVRAPTAVSAKLVYSYGSDAPGARCWFSRPLRSDGVGRFSGTLPALPGLAVWYFANCAYADGTMLSTEYEVAEPDAAAPEPFATGNVLYDPATDGRHPWYFSWKGPVARHPWQSWGGTDLVVSEIAGRPALHIDWGEGERPEGDLFRAFLRSPGCPARRGTGAEGVTVDVIGPRPLKLLLVAHEAGVWTEDANPFQAEVTLKSGEGWASVRVPLRDFRRRTPREETPEESPPSFDRVRQFHLTLESPEKTEVPVAVGPVRWVK